MAPRTKKGSPEPGLFDITANPDSVRSSFAKTPELNPALRDLFSRYSQSSIAGFDEVGRGPLAGPVVAACVVFPEGLAIEGLTDSKALSAHKRENLEALIRAQTWWGLGWLWPADIERINIHRASLEAMTLAWHDLAERFPGAVTQVTHGVSDGKFCPSLPYPCIAQVKGDLLVAQISAASILAKVTRDAWMDEAALKWPGYGFEQHKGYGTPMHQEAIRRLGPCPIHRLAWISPKLLSSS